MMKIPNNLKGLTTIPLQNNARLLARQNVHFTIYSKENKISYSSSEFATQVSKADWKS